VIKATGKHGDRDLILLGLSDNNLRELRKGNPIHIFADELGFKGTILIVWGRTEDALAREMTEAMIASGQPKPTAHDRRKQKRH
jgi:hypothetical protein